MSIVPSIDTLNLFPAAPTNHVIQFARMPELNYVVQEVNLPAITGAPVKIPSSGHKMVHVPDRVEYEPLEVTFLVDEQFRAHREIRSWLHGMTGGEDRSVITTQFINEQAQYIWASPSRAATLTRASVTSAGLTIVNGAKIPVLRVLFYNVIPVSLGRIQFSVKEDNLTAMACTATFEYEYYTMVELAR